MKKLKGNNMKPMQKLERIVESIVNKKLKSIKLTENENGFTASLTFEHVPNGFSLNFDEITELLIPADVDRLNKFLERAENIDPDDEDRFESLLWKWDTAIEKCIIRGLVALKLKTSDGQLIKKDAFVDSIEKDDEVI